MNIEKLCEELKTLTENNGNKIALEIYRKGYESLEELQELILDSAGPSGLDSDLERFYDELQNMINEIYSRSLAFWSN